MNPILRKKKIQEKEAVERPLFLCETVCEMYKIFVAIRGVCMYNESNNVSNERGRERRGIGNDG